MKTKNLLQTIAMSLVSFVMVFALIACEKQDVTNIDRDAASIETKHISPEMAQVRDYVPDMAVVAHRGSVFWVPEETEAAWRWAREIGADYLESDLQCSKDGVILANHDDNLKRTTNIENVFGETVPEPRVQFYMDHAGMTKAQAFFKVVLLQVIKRILPPMSNEIITLVKDTSLARVISVYELIWAGEVFIKLNGLLWPLLTTGIFYLAFNGLLTLVFGKLEKKLNYYQS
jgi:hypothetical protein